LMHLGMSGSFRVSHDGKGATPGEFHHPRTAAPAHDHVVFHMSSGATVTFNDPRRFGLMLIVPRSELEDHPLMREVGPEPLGNAFDADLLAAACAGKKTSLKAALLDQRTVAGLGNIYVDEALWYARLAPLRRAESLDSDELKRLHRAIRRALRLGIERQGASLRDYAQPDGESGGMQHEFRVYGRDGEPCDRCGTPIAKTRVAGRGTHYCPRCQHSPEQVALDVAAASDDGTDP